MATYRYFRLSAMTSVPGNQSLLEDGASRQDEDYNSFYLNSNIREASLGKLTQKKLTISTYFYIERAIMMLMRAKPFRGPLEKRVGFENRDFFGP